MGFVDGDLIPPACYDEPYRLEAARRDSPAYDVLRDVMRRTRKVGLAAVVIEKKQALAAVIPIGRSLVLNVLRFASALVPGARRYESAQPPRASAKGGKPRTLCAVPSPRKPRGAEPRAVARIAPAPRTGEVIDLAAQRSTKRAQRPARTGRGKGGVATLHELRRKGHGRPPGQRQLA